MLVNKNLKNRAKRTPMRSKPNAKRPNHIWGYGYNKDKAEPLGLGIPGSGVRLV